MKKILLSAIFTTLVISLFAADIIVTNDAEFKQAVSTDVLNGDVIKFNVPNNTLDLAQATKINIRCAEATAIIIDGALTGGDRVTLTNSITTTEEFFNYAGSTNVVDGASLTFKNLIIKDFRMNGRSGLIRSGHSNWSGAAKTNQIVFENVTFIGNQQATPAAADGLFDLRQGTILTFRNCSFINNKILPNEVPTTGKKTMFALNSGISGFNLINCTFYGNEIGLAASAQYLIENAGVNTNIINCSFINNTAPKGIMRIVKSKDYSYIINSLFAYNTASGADQTAVDMLAAIVSTDGLNTVSAQSVVAYSAFNSGSYLTPDAVGLLTGANYDQTTLFAGYTANKPNLNSSNNTVPLARNITGTSTFTGVTIPSADQIGNPRSSVAPTIGALEFLSTAVQSTALENQFKIAVAGNQLFIFNAEVEQYEIFNYTGNLMQSGSLKGNSITIQGVQKGVYFIKMKDQTTKFVL